MRLAIRRGALAFVAAQALASPGVASAACEGVSIAAPGNAVLNFDPFDELRETLDIDLIVRQRSATPCNLALSAQSMMPGVYREMRGSGNPVRYELRLGSQLLQNDLGSPVVIPGQIQGGNRDTLVRLRFEFPPGVLIPAGQYTDLLSLRTFDASGGTPVSLGIDASFTARLVVPASVRILLDGAITAANGRFGRSMIFLGELSDGAEANATLQIRATSGVRLSVASQNNGTLQHVAVAGDAGAIPYRLLLDGSPIDLRTGPADLRRQLPGGAGRENLRMQISVAPAGAKPAGTYRDVLTVTAEPN